MKYILMSIRAPYARLILEGQKTLEIRKTAPRKDPAGHDLQVLLYESKRGGGSGLIVGTFRCRAIHALRKLDLPQVCTKACLDSAELYQYAAATGRDIRELWAWQVEEPVAFLTPRPLVSLQVHCPPQSWRTVSAQAALDAMTTENHEKTGPAQ